jgi:hypothetical protein
MRYEKVFLGTNDVFRRQLSAGGKPVKNMLAVSRITLLLGTAFIDSDVNPEAFDWRTDAAEAIITFRLGLETLAPGSYMGILKLYSSDNPDGIEDFSPVPVVVIAAEEESP